MATGALGIATSWLREKLERNAFRVGQADWPQSSHSASARVMMNRSR